MFIKSVTSYFLASSVIFILTLMASNSWANSVQVVDVIVTAQGNKNYRFDVSLLHQDAGWDHYANRWEILDEKGTILATRILYHPHVNEQPFTRSLTVSLPDNLKTVIIRGHDNVHQYSGNEKKITLSK